MKSIIKSCLFLFSITMMAQEFNGIAYYQSKTIPDMDLGDREINNVEMRKNMEAHLEKMLNKTYELHFNKDESLYKEEEKLDTPGGNNNRVIMAPGIPNFGTIYKNIPKNKYLQEQDLFGKLFLITDSLPGLDWILVNESKQIGQYVAFKATAIIKPDNGKTASNQNEGPKEVEITAWYTPQIPIPQGPGEYWGLPGLILEIQTDKTSILCTKIVLNPKHSEMIKKPTKGTKVTREEYQKIAKEKIKEMQEMRGGQRGGFTRQGG